MKNFVILFTILIIILVSCENKVNRKTKEPEKDFLALPSYTTETTKIQYEPAPVNNSDGNSYWFIVVQNDKGTFFNSFIKQEHRYFSVSEAKAGFKEKVFIFNFVQVSKETYDNNQ
jgi:hypothetical protein